MKVIDIGYHYTSSENWLKIKDQGLIPYSIKKSELDTFFSEPIKGIWVWQELQFGVAHSGSVIFQMGTKGTDKVVLLSVNYLKKSLLSFNNKALVLNHSSKIENLWYHDNSQKAVIVVDTIHPKDIKLLETFELEKVWSYNESV